MKPQAIIWLKILSGPALCALLTGVMLQQGIAAAVSKMAGLTGWIAIWWITEAVPLAITALLPLVLFPLFGIVSAKATAPLYMNHVMFLFVGGFMVAFAMEKWNLHKRIALRIILALGEDVNRIMLGLMVASFALSMWISNTATTMMMIPTALAVLKKMDELLPEVGTRNRVAVAFLLAIAYGASIGGTATLVGTPPNLIFLSHYSESFPDAAPITFSQWFLFGLPLSVVLLGVLYFLLRFLYLRPLKAGRSQEASLHSRHIFEKEHRALGKMTFEEKAVAVLFMLMAVLWFSRAHLTIGGITLPGWSGLFPHPEYFKDGMVAVAIAVLLFVIPSRKRKREMLMKWKDMERLPFGIILLFGGGFAIARGFIDPGLTEWLGGQLQGLGRLPVPLMVVAVTFLTEITSNRATTQLVLPVMAAIAVSTGIPPLLLMIPVTFSASCAFMLPVATPPNVIVFGSERITIDQMMCTGIFLLAGVIVISLMMLLWGRVVFGV